jgi:hypothetical protein
MDAVDGQGSGLRRLHDRNHPQKRVDPPQAEAMLTSHDANPCERSDQALVPLATGSQAPATATSVPDGNGHGASANPGNLSHRRDRRFPPLGPLPGNEGDSERAASEFR